MSSDSDNDHHGPVEYSDDDEEYDQANPDRSSVVSTGARASKQYRESKLHGKNSKEVAHQQQDGNFSKDSHSALFGEVPSNITEIIAKDVEEERATGKGDIGVQEGDKLQEKDQETGVVAEKEGRGHEKLATEVSESKQQSGEEAKNQQNNPTHQQTINQPLPQPQPQLQENDNLPEPSPSPQPQQQAVQMTRTHHSLTEEFTKNDLEEIEKEEEEVAHKERISEIMFREGGEGDGERVGEEDGVGQMVQGLEVVGTKMPIYQGNHQHDHEHDHKHEHEHGREQEHQHQHQHQHDHEHKPEQQPEPHPSEQTTLDPGLSVEPQEQPIPSPEPQPEPELEKEKEKEIEKEEEQHKLEKEEHHQVVAAEEEKIEEHVEQVEQVEEKAEHVESQPANEEEVEREVEPPVQAQVLIGHQIPQESEPQVQQQPQIQHQDPQPQPQPEIQAPIQLQVQPPPQKQPMPQPQHELLLQPQPIEQPQPQIGHQIEHSIEEPQQKQEVHAEPPYIRPEPVQETEDLEDLEKLDKLNEEQEKIIEEQNKRISEYYQEEAVEAVAVKEHVPQQQNLESQQQQEQSSPLPINVWTKVQSQQQIESQPSSSITPKTTTTYEHEERHPQQLKTQKDNLTPEQLQQNPHLLEIKHNEYHIEHQVIHNAVDSQDRIPLGDGDGQGEGDEKVAGHFVEKEGEIVENVERVQDGHAGGHGEEYPNGQGVFTKEESVYNVTSLSNLAVERKHHELPSPKKRKKTEQIQNAEVETKIKETEPLIQKKQTGISSLDSMKVQASQNLHTISPKTNGQETRNEEYREDEPISKPTAATLPTQQKKVDEELGEPPKLVLKESDLGYEIKEEEEQMLNSESNMEKKTKAAAAPKKPKNKEQAPAGKPAKACECSIM